MDAKKRIHVASKAIIHTPSSTYDCTCVIFVTVGKCT